jgi:hypothetical protein
LYEIKASYGYNYESLNYHEYAFGQKKRGKYAYTEGKKRESQHLAKSFRFHKTPPK